MYTKTIEKVIWDKEKLNVGDLISVDVKTDRTYYDVNKIKAFIQMRKYDITNFKCIGFIKEINDSEISVYTHTDEGFNTFTLIAGQHNIEVIHKNPFI